MTQPDPLYRYRITFSKYDTLRFIGHLALAKTWERVFRRARLPLVYSQGFNPQPKIQLASALPLGITSEAELLDVWMKAEIDVGQLPQQLDAVSPVGLATNTVAPVRLKSPALQTRLHSAVYRIVTDDVDTAALQQRVDDLLAQKQIIRQRRKKTYDLRPLILGVDMDTDGALLAQLALGDRGSGRPDELLAALGLTFSQAHCHRLAIHLLPED